LRAALESVFPIDAHPPALFMRYSRQTLVNEEAFEATDSCVICRDAIAKGRVFFRALRFRKIQGSRIDLFYVAVISKQVTQAAWMQ
jgi:hypothetical protein